MFLSCSRATLAPMTEHHDHHTTTPGLPRCCLVAAGDCRRPWRRVEVAAAWMRAPGEAHREGVGLVEVMDMFPADAAAAARFGRIR